MRLRYSHIATGDKTVRAIIYIYLKEVEALVEIIR